ncbi:ferritin-like domain-containing protein [Kiritimatiellaeota bacterium B1221]|nr:ferritin-like domain-containing protein [Kiritimatiellaeota bacterium B1221]
MNPQNKALVENLNQDLAAEYQTMVMCNTYAASVLGEHRKQLRELFRDEIPDDMKHAKFLADKIVALKGTPTLSVPHAPKAENDLDMLENILRMRAETIQRYGKRSQEAEAAGDIALRKDLEEMIRDATRHMEECEKILRGFIQTP